MLLKPAIVAAVTSAVIAFVPLEALGRQRPGDAATPAALLDVPYLTQPEALCGGAALAMVLRYWGDRTVVAEDFAPRLDADGSGIRTSALVAAVRDRGWRVARATVDAVPADLETAVAKGRPAIVLIEDRPSVFHYVVVVAITPDVVVVHDSARRPFLTLARARFLERWRRGDNWLLLVLPRAAPQPATTESALDTSRTREDIDSSSPCDRLIAESVRLASADPEAAETGLLTATRLCPSLASAWTELAGLRILQSRWSDASVAARRAAALAPADDLTWRVLATSLYLEGDRVAALDAWNHVGEPRVDVVSIHGVARTPHPVVTRRLGLATRSLLTAGAYRRAERRLDDLPTAMASELRYTSVADGLAAIDARVLERPVVPNSWVAWSAIGLRGAVTRELGIDFGGLARSGDLLSAGWRWNEASPRIAFDFAVPDVDGLPGVFHLDASWERQTYKSTAADVVLSEERRRVGAAVEDWISDAWRVRAGAAIDRFDASGFVAGDIAIAWRSRDDRLSIGSDLGGWSGGGDRRFWTAAFSTAWQSTAVRDRPKWSIASGATYASADAPVALWQGAGAGRGRDYLLRAHTLDAEGVVTADVFGRHLLWATIEHERSLWHSNAGAIGVAGFADIARASHRLEAPAASPTHVDVGAGIRLRPSMFAAALRADLAYGLRDGRVQISAGIVAPWPGR
ncbi:MAG TPA: C39 family peptidase [Vicinamibacterales bacterium]|nr:C39 family peptidase [Vicinamibacterales bacterium]